MPDARASSPGPGCASTRLESSPPSASAETERDLEAADAVAYARSWVEQRRAWEHIRPQVRI
ncbi:hypothetical protein [Sorangium sp. So ce1000]|uniref:hypothetical protein n=1 Tax=Sorangium sp. So ce1000 TaxID=3133325 RepID=UPI003F6293AA